MTIRLHRHVGYSDRLGICDLNFLPSHCASIRPSEEDEEYFDLCSACNHTFLDEDLSTLYECLQDVFLYPIDVLLLYILKKSDAILAVVHHDGIPNVLLDNSVMTSTKDFVTLLETLTPHISVKNGDERPVFQ
ncbi:hypothetical protein M422DRAFT_267703 [Sphaerobolus stellatus SS14]|uniref:Uncharacterized protein n=1 Tax=Sphaerobolus stellatus (strain SS14) TaxID=990650 RepID=A0A0C9UZD7_SPHS4|nr:hypothetical protein M422DRAFT_267703 [Sphaerobolus stellatus SS14]